MNMSLDSPTELKAAAETELSKETLLFSGLENNFSKAFICLLS